MNSAGGLSGSAGGRSRWFSGSPSRLETINFTRERRGMKGPRDPGQPTGDRKSVPYAPDRDGKFHALREKSLSVKQLTQISKGISLQKLENSFQSLEWYLKSVIESTPQSFCKRKAWKRWTLIRAHPTNSPKTKECSPYRSKTSEPIILKIPSSLAHIAWGALFCKIQPFFPLDERAKIRFDVCGMRVYEFIGYTWWFLWPLRYWQFMIYRRARVGAFSFNSYYRKKSWIINQCVEWYEYLRIDDECY